MLPELLLLLASPTRGVPPAPILSIASGSDMLIFLSRTCSEDIIGSPEGGGGGALGEAAGGQCSLSATVGVNLGHPPSPRDSQLHSPRAHCVHTKESKNHNIRYTLIGYLDIHAQILIHRILLLSSLESLVLVPKSGLQHQMNFLYLKMRESHWVKEIAQEMLLLVLVSLYPVYPGITRYPGTQKYYNATWYSNIGGIQLIRCTVPVEPFQEVLFRAVLSRSVLSLPAHHQPQRTPCGNTG